jgi:quercetin dioxygenase-like cupin family protein
VSGGPVWGAESEDLNATLLEWPPGAATPEHVNEERDVAIVVVRGSATIEVDGEARELQAGEATIVEKGSRRRIVAGPDGVRYASVHLRRPGLSIKRAT